ncbi:MAG: hypothetical protein ACOCOO_04640, partial [Prevotella sp.]
NERRKCVVYSIYQTANGQGKDTETSHLCAEAVAWPPHKREARTLRREENTKRTYARSANDNYEM